MENKIFRKTVFSWPCVLWLWPENWFTLLFSLQTIFGLIKRAKRERERERRKKLAHSIHLIHPSHRSTHTDPSTGESHPSTDEITPRTHPPINPPCPTARSPHEPTNRSTHLVSDPLLNRPATFRSTHLVHQRVTPTNRSLFVPLSWLVLWFWFFCFDFCFLCCLYILILCNNICLDPKKMWETW